MGIKRFLVYDQMEINVPIHSIRIKDDKLIGLLDILSKDEQVIQSIEFDLIENYTRGWWKSKTTDQFTLSQKKYDLEIPLKKGEKYVLKFSMNYQRIKSKIEQNANSYVSDLFVEGLKKVGNVYSEYELIIKVKISGSPLKIIKRQAIEL